MSMNVDNLPLYIQLVETKAKTPQLVEEIIQVSQRFNLYDEVSLVSVSDQETDNGEVVLVYKIQTKNNGKQEEGENVTNFLDHIFRKMFSRFPSFTEPVEPDINETI